MVILNLLTVIFKEKKTYQHYGKGTKEKNM